MKKLFFLFFLILLVGCIPDESFCGTSTLGECQNNKECKIAGCSSQICQSKTEEELFTTCEYRECYNAEKYSLECQCIENECQWA